MFNQGLRSYRHMNSLLQLALINLGRTHTTKVHSCLCGQVYFKRINQRQDSSIYKNVRVHSTQSDQHRQKMVIETSSPVIDKIRYEKVSLDKEEAGNKTVWRDKIVPYVQLARWDKPIGVYLLYWPCSWSIALATITTGAPLSTGLYMGGLFLVGAGLMRGAGCTINDMWDRDIDKQVARTRGRPLATGAVSMPQATAFLAAQLAGALAVLLQLNCTTVALGASSLVLVVTYPLAKRFTDYPQLFLGATFNWGALVGYSAVAGAVDAAVCAPLYAGALAWTLVYDTIYAHQDKADDARIGVRSTALALGAGSKPALAGALAAGAGCLGAAGLAAHLSAAYALALAAYVAHLGRQIYTLDVDNPTDCANKFKSNSLVGLIILVGIVGGGYDTYLENRKKGNTGQSANGCLFG